MEQVVARFSTRSSSSASAQERDGPGLSVAKLGRFRINLFRQRERPVLPSVRSARGTGFDELNLPKTIKALAAERRGLIIVTGTTGSGKSTTWRPLSKKSTPTRP